MCHLICLSLHFVEIVTVVCDDGVVAVFEGLENEIWRLSFSGSLQPHAQTLYCIAPEPPSEDGRVLANFASKVDLKVRLDSWIFDFCHSYYYSCL